VNDGAPKPRRVLNSNAKEGENLNLLQAAAMITLASAPALGAAVVVPLDDFQSNLTLTLCIQGACTSDTATASGSFTLGIANVTNISTATVNDFNIAMSRPAVLNLDFGFLGRFFSTVSDFVVFDANPNVPQAPSSIAGQQFSYTPVTTLQSGIVNYDATGVVCANLTNLLLPCVGTIDLSTRPPTPNNGGGPCPGAPLILTVTSVGRTVHLSGQICSQGFLDPLNPSVGSLTITGTVSGSVTVPLPPCPADLNGDRAVNVQDLTIFLGRFGQSVTPGSTGDLNNDGAINTSDLVSFLAAFGVPCPS
jgi:hypothetical protein